MAVAYMALIVLYAGTLLVRNGYELLKAKGRIDTADQRVFATVFTTMVVMWISWFGIGFAAPNHLTIPVPVRWVGLAAVVIGIAMAVGGVAALRGVENIDHLVTAGIFSKIRHPMYVGFALWILGWAAWTGAAGNLLLAPIGLASIVWWRSLEERELASRYGEAYEVYRGSTWA